jgi:hypothetical protein
LKALSLTFKFMRAVHGDFSEISKKLNPISENLTGLGSLSSASPPIILGDLFY